VPSRLVKPPRVAECPISREHRIITCDFKPGECLNEASVSGLLGFGRTPVNQALDRSCSRTWWRSGVLVKPVVLQDVLQMIDVRMINETQCARLAAARADNEHIEKLSTVIGQAKTAIDRRDVHALMPLDREFHLVLATASRNLELAEIVRKLNERSLRLWFISFTTPDHHNSFQRQHEALYEAIRERDGDAAEHAMRVHSDAFRKSLVRHLQKGAALGRDV
jgi:GntR family transcriptional regulator, rspAB operon transcriptional repressor